MSWRRGYLTFCASVTGLVLLAASAEAKCLIQRYRVEVEVYSSRTGEPIAGARVAAFVNGAEADRPGSADTSGATTGPDGKVTHTFVFNTYSGPGILNADRCDAKLRKLEILVTHPDYRVKRVLVKRIPVSAATDGVGTILTPRVQMAPSRRSSPRQISQTNRKKIASVTKK